MNGNSSLLAGQPWRSMRGWTVHRRSAIAATVLALCCACVTLLALTTGRYGLPVAALLDAALGYAAAPAELLLLDLRLPRALAALAAGAAFATAGAIFQTLSRNPLASPDIIGLSTGSATGALVVILLLGEQGASLPAGAVAGGIGAAALVYAIARGQGAGSERLILVGIAIAAMLASVNDYLLTRAELDEALQAKTWLHGSLQGTEWTQVRSLALGCALLIPMACMLGPRLRLLEMGDDVATSLGVPVGATRAWLSLLGVALTALAVSHAGPIGFVALAAPQLARRLCRSPSIGLLSSAWMGAALCAGADLAARRALAPFEIPVGLVTGALGGAYLLYLLGRDWRRSGL